MSNKLIIITGLTTSGKSSIAMEIAKKYNGEIISCDSVQVYKGLDIGSAKESIENRKIIKHHLIDIVEPKENFNVGDFIKKAKEAISECVSRGKLPIICGGTIMYIKALLEGYTLGSISNPEFREYWENQAEKYGKISVWNALNEKDPELASHVHYNNLKRVIRYLEMSTFGAPKTQDSILKDFDVLSVGINLEKDKIYPIIDKRVDEMISSGLENEVKTLINKNLTLENNSMNTIGYREMYSYLKGEIDYERCVSLIKQHTRNYAKRQLTFMKSIKGIKIVSIEEARKLIEEFLN